MVSPFERPRCAAEPIRERHNLERIAFDWKCDTAPIKSVNPLDFHRGDQIHNVGGSPQEILPDRDLVYGMEPLHTKGGTRCRLSWGAALAPSAPARGRATAAFDGLEEERPGDQENPEEGCAHRPSHAAAPAQPATSSKRYAVPFLGRRDAV
jgi:hypothetical protein